MMYHELLLLKNKHMSLESILFARRILKEIYRHEMVKKTNLHEYYYTKMLFQCLLNNVDDKMENGFRPSFSVLQLLLP